MENPQKDPEGFERKTLHKLVDFTDKTVLEVGCGEGRLTWKYAASAKRVIGFDPDHDSLRVARADAQDQSYGARVHFANANAGWIPFRKETLDIAILALSL
jgi:ubiquinone/menaquinone biosynthesis C-methylase UbiE